MINKFESTANAAFGERTNEGGSVEEWTHTGNNLIGSFGIGWGVKDLTLDHLIESGADLAPVMLKYAKGVISQ
jgi:hypothetical protein